MAPGKNLRRAWNDGAQENEELSTQPTQALSSSAGSTSTTRSVCGPTQGLGIDRLIKKTKQPMKVTVDPEQGRPLDCDELAKLSSECHIIVRHFLPHNQHRYTDISERDKEEAFARLTSHIDIDVSPGSVGRKKVEEIFKARLSDLRHKWHKQFKNMIEKGLTVEEAREHCPSDILQVDWEWHIDNKWTNTRYQEKCLKNAQNWSHQTVTHSIGSCAFVPARHSMVDPESNEPISFFGWWKHAHTTKRNQWCCPKARELHDEMQGVRSEPTPDGHAPLSEDEVGMQVLGRKSGYVRGMGHGPKPPSVRNLHCSGCAALRSREAQLQDKLQSFMEKMEQMETERNVLSNKVNNLMQMFEEFRSARTTSPP